MKNDKFEHNREDDLSLKATTENTYDDVRTETYRGIDCGLSAPRPAVSR